MTTGGGIPLQGFHLHHEAQSNGARNKDALVMREDLVTIRGRSEGLADHLMTHVHHRTERL